MRFLFSLSLPKLNFFNVFWIRARSLLPLGMEFSYTGCSITRRLSRLGVSVLYISKLEIFIFTGILKMSWLEMWPGKLIS